MLRRRCSKQKSEPSTNRKAGLQFLWILEEIKNETENMQQENLSVRDPDQCIKVNVKGNENQFFTLIVSNLPFNLYQAAQDRIEKIQNIDKIYPLTCHFNSIIESNLCQSEFGFDDDDENDNDNSF